MTSEIPRSSADPSSDAQRADRPGRPRRGRDPRALPLYGVYRRFRSLAFGGHSPMDAEGLARQLFRALLEERPKSSPILGVRLYRVAGEELELIEKGGLAGPVELGYRIPAGHPVVAEALREGWAIVRRGDSRHDEWIERTAGTHALAKLALGPQREMLLSFTLREPISTAEVQNALTALRSLADSHLERQQFRELLEQARAVQTSLLPRQLPALPGFELAVRIRPAEVVGGDVYDLAILPPDSFAVCIADATGHGLPAALQARDVIVGLRMGMDTQLKMVATVEKLSRVLAGSSPAGRYVSLFFAEIDRDGHLIYINAGHPPAILLGRNGKRLEKLRSSGPLLGLDRRQPRHWQRHFERLEAGDLLALYTDGITEVRRPDDEEFGVDRLIATLRRHAGKPIEEVADAVLAAADDFGDGAPPPDDQTLILVRRR
ncbi:MAG: PP2C family protein-serine/threonine phosphatase [Holophagales bacterium]|nr:MAG: PP2C family protein-serine/threonine phosphatase [Holophagales bacterium]